jgi:hypothetical protein
VDIDLNGVEEETMARLSSLRRLAIVAVLFLAWAAVGTSTAHAETNYGEECVRDFFTVARVDYGMNPIDVVQLINTDGDPNFQVANVGELIDAVANAKLGIFDTSGVFHICAT